MYHCDTALNIWYKRLDITIWNVEIEGHKISICLLLFNIYNNIWAFYTFLENPNQVLVYEPGAPSPDFFLITNNILVFLGIKWNYQIVHCLLYKSHQGLSAHFPKDYSHILQQTEYVMLAMFLWGISLSKTVCLCFDFASSTSSLWPLKVETPQGSVLGLFLFLVFMYFLGDFMQSYSFKFSNSYISAVFINWTLECYMPPIRPHHNA